MTARRLLETLRWIWWVLTYRPAMTLESALRYMMRGDSPVKVRLSVTRTIAPGHFLTSRLDDGSVAMFVSPELASKAAALLGEQDSLFLGTER